VLLFVALGVILFQVNWPVVEAAVPKETISTLGQDLMGRYLVPFEVASVLLLVALVGSIIIARERE
jgi:NADH-quinone oxidoreductase subunit J